MKTDYTVTYVPELNIWNLKDIATGKERAVTEEMVQTFTDELWHIFNKAQANPNTIQGIALV